MTHDWKKSTQQFLKGIQAILWFYFCFYSEGFVHSTTQLFTVT